MSSDQIYWALKYFRPSTQKLNHNAPTLPSDSRTSYEAVLTEIEEVPASDIIVSGNKPTSLSSSKPLSIDDQSLIKEFFDFCDKGINEKVQYILENVDHPLGLLCQMDDFGWTPLMYACASGSVSTVQTLLDHGSKVTLYHEDAGHNSAISITKKFGFMGIAEILDPIIRIVQPEHQSNETSLPKNPESEPDNRWFCEICNLCYKNFNHHHSSISHLYNVSIKNGYPSKLTPSPQFGISRSNVGYKMMQAGGWDSTHGLGACKTGRLYPIRPKIKANRKGLGSKNQNIKYAEKSKIYDKRRKKPFTDEEIKGFRSSFR